jgi:predicted permease
MPDPLPLRLLDAFARDARYALRRLARDWRFTAGAVLILALGIGANTAVFSILNTSLFEPHPFLDSARLVNIYQNDARTGEPEAVSYPAFLGLQRESSVFSIAGAARIDGGRYQTIDDDGKPGPLRSTLVEFATANYLELLGLRPVLGRWFTPAEEARRDPVAVLGYETWRREFAADPRVLGRTLIAGGTPVQIIGVGPAVLNSTQSNLVLTAWWLPVTHLRPVTGRNPLELRDELLLQVRARLSPGVTLAQAQAALDVAARRFAADYPDTDPRRGITVLASDDVHVHPREKLLKPVAAVLLSVVGLVLAIACSNLATLLLVRSSARAAEISIRLALGATRAQLLRHLLIESLVLSLCGAAAGVALAHWGLRYLATIDLPAVLEMHLDYRVLGFAIAIATLSGLGFGLTPALQATRVDVAGALRDERGSTRGALSLVRGWFNLKNGLVAGQVAASFLLLTAAVVAFNIVSATRHQSVGYRPDGLAIVQTDPDYAGFDAPRAAAVLEELRRHAASLPGVESAIATSGLPIDGEFERDFLPEGSTSAQPFRCEGRWAGPGYFHTTRIPLLFGRVFDSRDTPASLPVAVVSEAFAQRYFHAANAVGRRLRLVEENNRLVEIIGVVGNARSIDMVSDEPKKSFYLAESQAGITPTTLVARTAGDEAALAGLLQSEVRRLHPELPVTGALTMRQRQDRELALFRVALGTLSSLGALGLLLAAVGLYAVVSYAVAQRSAEIGIRIALGARAFNVIWLVVRDVSILVLAGIAVGAAVSALGLTLLESSVAQILGVSPWAVLPVAIFILASGAAAAFAPARRATLTDPIAAIRHQ